MVVPRANELSLRAIVGDAVCGIIFMGKSSGGDEDLIVLSFVAVLLFISIFVS